MKVVYELDEDEVKAAVKAAVNARGPKGPPMMVARVQLCCGRCGDTAMHATVTLDEMPPNPAEDH